MPQIRWLRETSGLLKRYTRSGHGGWGRELPLAWVTQALWGCFHVEPGETAVTANTDNPLEQETIQHFEMVLLRGFDCVSGRALFCPSYFTTSREGQDGDPQGSELFGSKFPLTLVP